MGNLEKEAKLTAGFAPYNRENKYVSIIERHIIYWLDLVAISAYTFGMLLCTYILVLFCTPPIPSLLVQQVFHPLLVQPSLAQVDIVLCLGLEAVCRCPVHPLNHLVVGC